MWEDTGGSRPLLSFAVHLTWGACGGGAGPPRCWLIQDAVFENWAGKQKRLDPRPALGSLSHGQVGPVQPLSGGLGAAPEEGKSPRNGFGRTGQGRGVGGSWMLRPAPAQGWSPGPRLTPALCSRCVGCPQRCMGSLSQGLGRAPGGSRLEDVTCPPLPGCTCPSVMVPMRGWAGGGEVAHRAGDRTCFLEAVFAVWFWFCFTGAKYTIHRIYRLNHFQRVVQWQ